MVIQNRSDKRRAQAAMLGATLLGATLATAQSSAAAELPHSHSGSPDNAHNVLYLDDDAWISGIGMLLYFDPDTDGYFSGLSLSIDADTEFNRYEVYAAIDIVSETSASGQPIADQSAAGRLHTTRKFDLYGTSSNDEYRVDIDLIQNYRPGIYDLHVTLFDAHDHQVLDQVGARDFSNLRALPLESEDYQSAYAPVYSGPSNTSNDDVQVTEYAGATGFGMLGLFVVVAFFRIRKSLFLQTMN